MKICKQCGKDFKPVYPNSQYCSDRCKKDRNNEYFKVYRATHKEQIKAYRKG